MQYVSFHACTLEGGRGGGRGGGTSGSCLVTCLVFLIDNYDMLNEHVLKKHHPDLIEYMKV